MGAPRKWIKTLLGLKKSDKSVSSEEEKSSKSTGKIWLQRKHSTIEIDSDIFENDLNQDVGIEYKDANSQSTWDLGSSLSTSLEVQNAAELQRSMREEWVARDTKDTNFQSACGSPSTSFQVQTAAQFNKREEWESIDAKDANFQSVPGPTSSPSTQLQVKKAAQCQQNLGEECAAIDDKDANFLSIMDSSSPPSTSLHGQHAAELQQDISEDWAAMRIQTAFRGFLLSTSPQLQNRVQPQQTMSEESAAIRIQTALRGLLARRTLHSLKGLVRLQALVRGHAVRRQAAITLRCMQALVRVQARTRARHARMALENQAAQRKLQEQESEVQVKTNEDGWCDSAGSANEIQAKLLKRKEAAAKREKAKSYALARQWQARPQQQATPLCFEPDKSNWGWNWLERWMAVRPWENRISDINLQEGMKILENESGRKENGPKTPLRNSGKGKSGPRLSTITNISSNEKRASSHSDGSFSPSPNRSGNASPTTLVSSRTNSTRVVKKSGQEATSRPNLGPRSLSNPKERSTLPDKQGNKRLSLPGAAQGAQPAAKGSPTAHRLGPTAPKPPVRNKSSNGIDVKGSKLSRQVSH